MKENYLKEQCQEYFDIVEKDKTIVCYNDQRKFKNGNYIKNFWKRNSYFIYQEISLAENKEKYPNAYIILSNLYNKGIYYLTDEQRFQEFFNKMEELGYMITKDNKLVFSDGYKYSSFIIRYHDYIVNYATEHSDQFPKSFKIIKDYLINKDAFLTKCIEFFEMIEKDNKMISSNDTRLFTNNEKVKYFWFRNYEKIYTIICSAEYRKKYPNTFTILNEVYITKKERQKTNPIKRDRSVVISFEEKMHTILSFMEENKRKVNVHDNICFLDNTRYYYFWSNHTNEFSKTIKLEKNKEKYPFVYNMLSKMPVIVKKRDRSFSDKTNELVNLVEKHGNMKFVYNRNNRFSDNTKLFSFWYNHCDLIYKTICELEKEGTRLGYTIIKEEYAKKKFAYDDKIIEFIELVEQYGQVLSSQQELIFSDGKKVESFWDFHKQDIIIKFCDENIRKKYPNACILLQRLFYQKQFMKIRFLEYLELIEKYNSLLYGFPALKFSDQTCVRSFIFYHRDYIYNEIENDEYKEKYPIAYGILKCNSIKRKVKIKK